MAKRIELKDLRNVGRLGRTHGINGGVVLQWHSPFFFDSVDLSDSPFLFLLIDGLPVPFRVTEMEERADGKTVVVFAQLQDVPQPVSLQGLEVYAHVDIVDEELVVEGLCGTYDALVGLTLRSEEGTIVGVICGVEEYSTNVVMDVEREDGTAVLIPLAEDLVVSLPSEELPELVMRIPEGLL